MFDTILFDLDGTLTDPFEGITNSIIYALDKYGITVEDKRSLIPFIGPPLDESFRRFYGFDEEQALQAVKYYREYFSVKGLYENKLYDGIINVLSKLKSSGKTIIMATSKPEQFAIKIADCFGLTKYFDSIVGATMDFSRVKKPDVISHALKICGITDKSKTIMIGDREHDIFGAKANSLKCAGVLYGYGTEQELLAAGADYIIPRPKDIIDITL